MVGLIKVGAAGWMRSMQATHICIIHTGATAVRTHIYHVCSRDRYPKEPETLEPFCMCVKSRFSMPHRNNHFQIYYATNLFYCLDAMQPSSISATWANGDVM